MLCQGRNFLETSIHVFKGTSENKKKKWIKGNFQKKSLIKFQSKKERFVDNFFWSLQCEGIIINIIMKIDSGSGIEGVEFEGMERNERRQRK